MRTWLTDSNMNPKTQAIIDAARLRTQQLLKDHNGKHEQSQTSALPSSLSIEKNQSEARSEGNKQANRNSLERSSFIISPAGIRFDPYEIVGVGRANDQQSCAIKTFGIDGRSGCLIGPAGTGKTTTMRAIIQAMIQSGRIPILSEGLAHKYLRGGLPGIYGGAFTRIATRNLKNNCPPDIQANIHTHHRLLEFEPEMFSVVDEKTGKEKTVRLFKPTRNSFRTLPKELVVYLFDETSMLGMRLHEQIIDAIHPAITPQMLYIGDIAQIPPVMDDAILGYKMLEHLKTQTCIELKEVYRHAGAIVNLANHIRVGSTVPDNRSVVPYLGNLRKLPKKTIDAFFLKDGWTIEDSHQWYKEDSGSKVTIKHWKNRLDGEVGQLKALQNLAVYGVSKGAEGELVEQKGFFIKELENGNYDPMKHMILMPYNKGVGTIELNRYISNYIGKVANDGKGAEVYEVIAGRAKHYIAVGDKVFYEREEAIITKININANYAGRAPQAHSVTLDRWGHNSVGRVGTEEGYTDDIEMLLNIDIGGEDDDERKNQASHIIYIKKIADLEDSSIEPDSINTAAEINGLILGYALTIHKSQGSQWPKVYCIFHNSHNRNLQRELLYTAITRAQKELYIICEPESFIQGVISQHIVGNTLEEKAKFFIAKAEEAKKRKDLFTNGPKTIGEE